MVEKRFSTCLENNLCTVCYLSLSQGRERKRRKKRELYRYLVSRYYVLYTRVNFLNYTAKRGKRAAQQKGLLRRVLS